MTKNVQIAIQRSLVQNHPDASIVVRGNYTGDFVGKVVAVGRTGVEYIIKRSLSPSAHVGEQIWVPYAPYIMLTIDEGE